MESRERFKVKEYGGDCCDFEQSSTVSDAFELLNPDEYPQEQRGLVEEFNRRAEIGNQRYRISMYRAEMFEKGFNAGMYICTFDHEENMTSFVFTDETRRLLGYDGLDDLPNEFDSWVKTLLPDQREAMVPIFWNTVKNHRQLPDISHAEYPMVRKDGKIIWVTGAGRFICREDGTLEIYMGCYRDVTAEHEKDDYLHIIEGIGKVFNFSLYINMSDGTYRIVSTNEYVEKVRKDSNAFQFLRNNVDSSVNPDFRNELNAWLQPEVISDLLKDKETTSKDFFSAEADMWFRGIFMVGDRNEDGSLNHIIYGCQDITEVKRSVLSQKAELEKTISKLSENQEIIHAAGFGIWKFSLSPDGRISGMMGNDDLRNMYGYEKENPTPEEFLSYFVNGIENEADDLTRYDYSPLETGKVARITYPWKHPVKGTIYIEAAGIKHIDSEGNSILFGSAADVTETVLAERKQKEQLQAAIEAAEKQNKELNKQLDIIGGLTNAYFICIGGDVDKNEYTIYKENDFLHELLKSGGCERVDSSFNKYIPLGVMPEDQQKMCEFTDIHTLPSRMGSNDVISIEFHGTVPELEWCRASWIAVTRDADGRAYRYLFIMSNITEFVQERKRQENELKAARDQAEAANRAKTSFLFNMSHDIRTPMNAIMGFRDLLEKHQDDPKIRQDYLNKIHDSSTVLLSIINNVLEMARIEKGTLEIEQTAWSIEQFNDSLYSVFHVMMDQKGLYFTRQIDVIHHYVYCDSTKMREIFLNILSNAYKYTNAGGSVHMLMEELPYDKEGWALYRTTISDTGIGMSEEFLPHIFEEFSREQNTTDAKIEGTGLGMPIVKRLVKMLDGTIDVKSKKGEGSTFTVTIPLKIAEKTGLVEHTGVTIDPELFKGKRILLAEDNELNAEIAMEILGEAGFITERAEDGKICVDMLEKADAGYYDLILMDIQMPNMNGYEATRTIRKMEDQKKANIKILAMTANAFEEDRREALKAGMNGHLAKPIDVKELMKILAAMIG